MGLWVNTTYVSEGDPLRVADALVAMAQAEGMQCVDSPPARERLLVEPMQYEPARFNDLWGVALFPGAPGWCAIQSAPLELLGERAEGAPAMRLASLCRRLGAFAFSFNLYDGTDVMLVEATPSGDVAVSGINTQSHDPLRWNDEPIDEAHYEAAFRLLPVAQNWPDGGAGDAQAAAVAAQFGGANARYCDNGVSVDTLVCRKPFTAAGGLVRYFAWPGPSRQRYQPLASWAEWQALKLQR